MSFLSNSRSLRRRQKALPPLALLSLICLILSACSAIVPAQSSPVAAQPEPSAVPEASAQPAGTSPPTVVTTPSAEVSITPAASGSQPVALKGRFSYTNDIITTYYVEHAVALVDMYGFVTRDEEWEVPVEAQTLGYLVLDEQRQQGTFELQLPARPQGSFVDVDNDGEQDPGVQVFVLSYWPNLTGSPYSVGDDRSRGWPSYLASTVNNAENKDEVVGGSLVVWSPDAAQQFPTGFGPDGLLFTDDDPVGPLPAGYAVVDLDQQPFSVSQEPEPSLTLHEPNDAAIKDFSELSYTDAFQRMFEQVRQEYAFNGIEGKEPAWDQLYAELMPRVTEAQAKRDAEAFFLALRDFANAFRDGHVGLGGGKYQNEVFREQASNGYGLAVRELDDGRFIVVYVLEDGPAAKAGIKVGAEVTSFNDKPIGEATSAVQPLSGPFSTDFALRYEQQRHLTRAPAGAQAKISFRNPGAAVQTVTLTAVEELESFYATSLYAGFDPNALPVEFELIDGGIGYVKINSNYDDLNLIVRLFERALKTFTENQSPGLIVDLRQNSGGATLGLAGFLTDREIELGQLQYYSDQTKKFEAEGPPDRIEPNERQYSFPKMALLVNQACYSACEMEAYGFSKVPGMAVIGQYPTAGVEAEVARGQYRLPNGISLQIPTGRYVLPDGSLFLEGTGVEPTRRVPINQETVLSSEDVVLRAAVGSILGR